MQAIMRAASIETFVEIGALTFVGIGLIAGAASISEFLVRQFPFVSSKATTCLLCVAFIAALAFVIWSFVKKKRTWTNDLKNVVPLENFLTFKSVNTVLGPNLSNESRQVLQQNLEILHGRADVLEIIVGILPDEGNISDRILIKTYAPQEIIRTWPGLLGTGANQISFYRYQVHGARRKVRSLLFIWD